MKSAKIEKVLNKFSSLPPEAQKEVADFISLLYERYKGPSDLEPSQKKKLTEEEFIGIWKDRSDMEDSTLWVRDIRKKEVLEKARLKSQAKALHLNLGRMDGWHNISIANFPLTMFSNVIQNRDRSHDSLPRV